MRTRTKLGAAAIAALVVSSAMGVAAPTAHATFPDHTGPIAFRRYLNEDRTRGAVFTLKPDGTHERQITFPPPYVDRNTAPQARTVGGALAGHQPLGGRRARRPPTVSVGGATGVAVDHDSGSVYAAGGAGVVVFDGTTCNARIHSGCVTPPIRVSHVDGIGAVVDHASDTLYVANPTPDTVTVVDTSTCNARVTTGCSEAHPTVPVGRFPSHLALDRSHATLYVANEGEDGSGNTVSMIDIAACNAHVATGCDATPSTFVTGFGPTGMVVDPRTHTLYVNNGADGTVSVVDTATCNASNPDGCVANRTTIPLSGGPVGSALDSATGTLVVSTYSFEGDTAGEVQLINTATCNATVLSGCGETPATVTAGTGGIDVAVNPLTRRAYVVNQNDSDISVIDLRRCNAQRTDGCQAESPTMDIGFDGGGVAVDAFTDTIYGGSQEEGTVTVLDGTTCNSKVTIGCRHPAPTTTVRVGPNGAALDHHTNTLYVADEQANRVSVIGILACNAHHRAGCATSWPTIAVGEFPKAVVVDEAFDTLYTSNQNASTVSVVDTRACNAQVATGCGQTPQTITVSGGAYTLAIDDLTHTVYVANVNSDTITAINSATCNGHVTTGCGQTPLAFHVGGNPAGVLVDPTTRTLYVSIRNQQVVAVIDADTCNSTITSGCVSDPPTVPITAAPRFLTVDPTTNTLYVSTKDNSTVAMVDTSSCNGHHPAGCSAAPAVVHVGYLPYGVVTDPLSHRLFVGNVGDSTVTAYDTRKCNAHTTARCDATINVDAGGWPLGLTIDDQTQTLYVRNNTDASVSIIDARHPLRP